MITKVLQALDLFLLQDQPLTSAGKFVAIRRDSGRPVAVVITGSEFERLESFLSGKSKPRTSCIFHSLESYDTTVLIIWTWHLEADHTFWRNGKQNLFSLGYSQIHIDSPLQKIHMVRTYEIHERGS